MPGKVGTSTIYTTIIPNFAVLRKIYPKKLTREMKLRLEVLDFYYHRANKNISLTSRRFGVSRTFIYKWLKRFKKNDLRTIETKSRKPHHIRSAQYDARTVSVIRKIRKEYPNYSAKKISIILKRDYDIVLSHATVGRIIKKYHLFFSKIVQYSELMSNKARLAWQTRKAKEKRLKYYLKTDKPHHIIEFDMKHINNNGKRQYALCAIDQVTKEAVIHIASSATANAAKIAIEKVISYFGKDIIIVNDNGSENFGATMDYLDRNNIVQLFARPHTPKDKPHIENFIGKYQKECLDESLDRCLSVSERQKEADKWLRDWHYYRPHQALGYLTPAEYCATIGITI